MYDLIIIGSGPAGLAAAIYAKRAELNAITIEKNYMSGGQVLNTYEVDNYPGFVGINGFDLGTKFREHANELGAKFVEAEVQELICDGKVKKVVTNSETFETKAIIFAGGAQHRKLGVPGEEELTGKGVSYCATCDGAFFRDKTTAVVGGGDVAVEDAIFLGRLCKKVYLIHRRHELRAAKSLQNRLFEMENVEIIWDSVVNSIHGEDKVDSIEIENVTTDKKEMLKIDGVFVAVGIQPNTELLQGKVSMDKGGYILAGEEGITDVPGIFVAGDARKKALRQIITAASDGANAVTSVQAYLL